jgi:hypothetical protein
VVKTTTFPMRNSGTDYQRKLWPKTEIVYVVSDGQITQPPTTVVGQVESERSMSVLHILNRQQPLEFQRGLC